MKPILFSTIIVIPLIIIFVVVDCKKINSTDNDLIREEVSSRNDTVTGHESAPNKSTESMQAIQDHDGDSHTATNIESNQTDTNTSPDRIDKTTPSVADDSKTSNKNETISVNLNITSATKTESLEDKSHLPAAIPVLTPEEAIKANQDAIKFFLTEKEKEEPFYKLYEKSKLELISFEGTVRATSLVPNPNNNDYDNCLYSIFVELDSVLSKSDASNSVSYEVVVNVPIMKDKKVLANNKFMPGDMINCLCVEYDEMPQGVREIQLSDDIQSFEHQQYYAVKTRKVSSFQTTGNKNFAKREITVLPIQSLPREERSVKLRQKRIQEEISRIESDIKAHGGSFKAWKDEYKTIAEKYSKLRKEEHNEWIGDSFFAANGNETSYKTKEYINSILPYKKYLEDNNIDLIVLRIPGKGDFSARVLAADDFQENPAWVEHYYECLKNDIEIVDPMPLMWEYRFDLPLFYYFNDNAERHPFEGTHYYSSIAIAEVLKRYDYDIEPQSFSLRQVSPTANQTRFLYPAGNEKFPSTEHVQYKQVILNGKPLIDLSQNTGSPFLFLGNCFFGRYIIKDLALPLYTAYQLRTIPDYIYREGVTTGLIRHLFGSQGLLSNRKAVILIGMPDIWNACSSFPRYLLSENVKITLEETIQLDSERIAIQEDSCYFGKRKEGGFWVEPEECKTVSFLLSIPMVQDKNTCMLRFKWLKTGGSLPTINIYNASDNSVIEYGAQPGKGQNTFCDFFIPMAETGETTIRIQLKVGSRNHVLDNIELWYY